MDVWRQKTKEAHHELIPHVQQLLDVHPYLRGFIVLFSATSTAFVLAWTVMPSILRILHKFSTNVSTAFFSGSKSWGPVPYEKSAFGAFEDPLRNLVIFMAFSQIAQVFAPSIIESRYLAQAWKGAALLTFVWCVQLWKTILINRALAAQNTVPDRKKLLTFQILSSVGLFVLGLLALVERCGVSVETILIVCGIGGVATAFAAIAVLRDVLSGLSRPFSVGDTIEVGNVEGEVIKMGLMTTSLLSVEKILVMVRNSIFSKEVIVNKSRVTATKIPLLIGDFEKIALISDDIKGMLTSNKNVDSRKLSPYCFLSNIENSHGDLTFGCILNHMSKEELYLAEKDILMQSVGIIKKHGAILGSDWEKMSKQ